MPRLYLGNKSRHYNMFLMLRAYDETTKTLDFTNGILADIQVLLKVNNYDQPINRETVYGVYRRENEFKMVNYLDRVGVRTHLCMRGSGSYILSGQQVDYREGDIIVFEPTDFGQVTRHEAEHDSLHLVNCWSKSDRPRNWQLFADSQEHHTAWPGLGGDVFFKPEGPK
jgi:hypothetical protein